MWSLRRPRDAQLAAILADVAGKSVTYKTVGMSTRGGAPGYHVEDHRVRIAMSFDEARERLATFQTHALPYLFVYPRDARVHESRDVVVSAHVMGVWSINPCRIVHVEDTADRYTYSYGTLPGHAESGEESFTVTRDGDGVLAETVAYAKMFDLLARLTTPIARRIQRKVKVDYLRALAEPRSRT